MSVKVPTGTGSYRDWTSKLKKVFRSKVKKTESPAKLSIPAPTRPVIKSIPSREQSKQGGFRCPSCYTLNSEKAVKCAKCGFKLMNFKGNQKRRQKILDQVQLIQDKYIRELEDEIRKLVKLNKIKDLEGRLVEVSKGGKAKHLGMIQVFTLDMVAYPKTANPKNEFDNFKANVEQARRAVKAKMLKEKKVDQKRISDLITEYNALGSQQTIHGYYQKKSS